MEEEEAMKKHVKMLQLAGVESLLSNGGKVRGIVGFGNRTLVFIFFLVLSHCPK
jgi:nucleoredoxin